MERAAWRAGQQRSLLEFGARSRLDRGFGWLDERGTPLPDKPLQLWINARMTYVFALAELTGDPADAGAHATHGIEALTSLFADAQHGGWYDALDPAGRAIKTSYGHAFVLLSSATAAAAGISGAAALFERAQHVVLDRFWDESAGRCVEQYRADWAELDSYRGANSNMHECEAFLAAGRVTGDVAWYHRAASIAQAVIDGDAQSLGWRVPEHFDDRWRPLLDYNRDRPADPFRPYGATVGHWFEWARLLITLDRCLPEPPSWLVDDATALFDTAVAVAWPQDDAVGIAYTIDWSDQVVVDARLHWVMCEAVLAADALHRRTGHERAARLVDVWWSCIERHFVDTQHGSWWHELDAQGQPATTIWTGKPDVYHAYQAVLLPDLPLGPPQPAGR